MYFQMPWAHAGSAGPISNQLQRDFVSKARQKTGWEQQKPAHLEVNRKIQMLRVREWNQTQFLPFFPTKKDNCLKNKLEGCGEVFPKDF